MGCTPPPLLDIEQSDVDNFWQLESCRRPTRWVTPKFLCFNPSPLIWQDWEKHLVSHPNRSLAKYVVQGIRQGFRIGFNYLKHKTKRSSSNMYSADEHQWVVQEYLLKECREGRVVGPLDPALLP